MTFAYPWFFVLWLAAPLLVLLPWMGTRPAVPVASVARFNNRMSLRRALAFLPTLLRLLAWGLMVMAMARPQSVHKSEMVESEGLDIILAVDTSLSMREADFTIQGVPTDRLTVAKSVMDEFIAGRPHDRIGVVLFGEEAYTKVPLTLDHLALRDALARVELGDAGGRGTAIGTAIAVSAKGLKDLDAKSKLMIVLTDGRSNSGNVEPMEAATAAAALGIKVYAIGVGAVRNGLIPNLGSGLDEKGLQAIATKTQARYFRAKDTDSLKQIYETIDQLEPSTAEVTELVSHTEWFRWPLIPGVLAFLLSWLLQHSWLRRGP